MGMGRLGRCLVNRRGLSDLWVGMAVELRMAELMVILSLSQVPVQPIVDM